MRTRILALVAAISLAVAGLATAPAASAATTFTDQRAEATMSELPISETVYLNSFTASADDPTDCSTLTSSAWTRIELASPSTIDISGAEHGWSWSTIVGFYPVGSDTAAGCKALEAGRDAPFEVPAGTYDVVVGTTSWWLDPVYVYIEVLTAPANDDWTAAQALDLPATSAYDMRKATLQAGEPLPPCSEEPAIGSQWFTFTAPAYGWVDVSDNWTMTNTYALYTMGASGVPVYADQCVRMGGTMRATPGATYLLQVSGYSAIAGTFSLHESGPPDIALQNWPGDPSTYDDVSFALWMQNGAADSCSLDFGDGSPIGSTNDCVMAGNFYHRYAKDGTYTLTASVVARDGRTGSMTQQLVVVTHDVAVASVSAPRTAAVGKAKQIGVSVSNLGKYAESTSVHLYAGTPETGWTLLGSAAVPLPVSRKAVSLSFTWIPTAGDVGTGVRLKAVVDSPFDAQTQTTLRDARPENNEVSTAPIKVSR